MEKACLNELIPGTAVNSQLELYSFKKIIFRKNMFYSKACEKVKKRNSYTVIYTSNTGDGRVGEIAYFLKVKDQVENICHFLAAMYEMKSFPDEAIMANVVVSTINKDLGHHLLPFHEER
jgi:hypothetical protein